MPNGIIVVDKPAGWTSMDVCAKLRGVYREKRVGHAGTLDPMATGVLPVFVGRATRAAEFAEKGEKEYVAGLRLGLVTNTQDTLGEVLEQRTVSVTQERVQAVLERFRGEILQIPPMYSAIKINGKKLYELARRGQEVARPARTVCIRKLELMAAPPVGRSEEHTVWLRVRCSKGTYIRTLCHDIGQALGCGGCMSWLRRTMAAGFTEADSVSLERILAEADPSVLLQPVDTLFSDRPQLVLDPAAARKVRNGAAAALPAADGEYRVYGPEREFLALGRVAAGVLTTIKSFFEV